jgi:hypothetical protein
MPHSPPQPPPTPPTPPPSPPPGADLARIVGILLVGMVATLLFTAQITVVIREAVKTPVKPVAKGKVRGAAQGQGGAPAPRNTRVPLARPAALFHSPTPFRPAFTLTPTPPPPPRPSPSSPQPSPPFEASHYIAWGAIAAVSLAATLFGGPDLAARMALPFGLAATVGGFLIGARPPHRAAACRLSLHLHPNPLPAPPAHHATPVPLLLLQPPSPGNLVPAKMHGVLHPVVVTAVIANAGAALHGALRGLGYDVAQKVYLAKVRRPGGGALGGAFVGALCAICGGSR